MTAMKLVNLTYFRILIAVYITGTIISYVEDLKYIYSYIFTLLKVSTSY